MFMGNGISAREANKEDLTYCEQCLILFLAPQADQLTECLDLNEI